MNLQAGTRLRQYEILEAIGAGGMGEVYRARDTNLDRDVAVKVLPARLADNPLNLARLEREAKAIAALSHPNILAVYDFGSEADTAFVVTELLEGETLRARLAQGPLPPRKATEIGRQIARGLAAAHDKGIVHRDLKPENIYLSGDGRVKILDFGLASGGDEAEADHDSATLTNLTLPGSVLGTVDYMSPEQVRGQATDNRSDLFSFGLVLYEMVGGTRPFHRETNAETMTAILKEEAPDLATMVEDTPQALAAITRRCLEKRAGERFHSAHDLAFSLEALSGSAVTTGTAAALAGVSGPRRRPGPLAAALLVLLGLIIGGAAVMLLRPAPAAPEAPSFTILSSRRGTVTSARFVGEGEALYSAAWDNNPQRLFPASETNRTAAPLAIEGAELLSVSADGELALSLDRRYPIGFEAIGTLAVAQPGGTAPRAILENVLAADWAPDGRSLAVVHEVAGDVRLEYPIGTVLYESPGWISSLRVHPDGDRIVFADAPVRGDNQTYLRIVDTEGTVQTLGPGGHWGALWTPDGADIIHSTGHLVYSVRPGSERRRIYSGIGVVHLLDVDTEGRVLAAMGMIRREMYLQTRGAGAETNLSWQDWSTPRALSEDGRVVLFEEGNTWTREGYPILLRGADGSPPQVLVHGAALAMSPDGAWIASVKHPFSDAAELELVPTGPGVAVPVPVAGFEILLNDGAWLAPDEPGGRGSLLLNGREPGGVPRLLHLPLDGAGPPRPITPADLPLAPQGLIVSPDGRRVIVTPVSGSPVEFGRDGSGPLDLRGLEAGDLPLAFDRDGRHIYVQGEGNVPAPIFRVDLETGDRRAWSSLSPRDTAGIFRVDRVYVASDGANHVYSTRRMISSLAIIEGLRWR